MKSEQAIKSKLEEILGLKPGAAELETPPDKAMGDYAFPCFKLAKQFRKAPNLIAAELAEKLSESGLSAQAAGGDVNFRLDRTAFAKDVLEAYEQAGASYGASSEGQGRAVCVDYSSINIAKPFHIGHFRTTVIGHSLCRIYAKLGYKPVGINHLGDYGTQFGKLIVAYKRYGDRDAIEQNPMIELMKIYVRFHEEAEKDKSLEDEAREWFRKIEDGDEEAQSLFEWFKDMTLREVKRVYDDLDIEFDYYTGESFYNDKMAPVIGELREKGLLELNDGASVVDLAEYNMPPCLILKADGASLYATRDLAAAIYRKETFDFAKSLYVVAYQQDLHFKQVFKVLELIGREWAKDMEHVSFGMVSLEDAALSTRKGNVVLLVDVMKKAVEKAMAIIEEKSPGLADKETAARRVGVGALVFDTLSSNRIKDISFSWDRALNFDGETGPYCQYTHARACSVLAKAEWFPNRNAAFDKRADCHPPLHESPNNTVGADGNLPVKTDIGDNLSDDEAFELLRLIEEFPGAIKEAARKNEPFIITRFALDIAKAFNKFYYEHRIMDDDESIRTARLRLTAATRGVLAEALRLIGLYAPEKM